MISEQEIWKDIPGYEGCYQASTMGRIKSLKRMVNKGSRWPQPVAERLMRLNSSGRYKTLELSKNGITKSCLVHRLIALTFIEQPEGKYQVNHINGIKTDNRIENLEWCTHTENVRHAVRTGLSKGAYGSKNRHSKLTEEIVYNIITSIKSGAISNGEVAKKYGIIDKSVRNIMNKKTWKHVWTNIETYNSNNF